jgi:hypothetical protein
MLEAVLRGALAGGLAGVLTGLLTLGLSIYCKCPRRGIAGICVLAGALGGYIGAIVAMGSVCGNLIVKRRS